LLSYCDGSANSFSDDRPQTPTLHDPKGERNSKGIERFKLLESRHDGLSGVQEYLANVRDSANLLFVLLFLDSIKQGENLNMYFISWDNYIHSHNPELMNHQELMKVDQDSNSTSFNILDLDNYFPDLPINFYQKNYFLIKEFTDTTEADLCSSARFYPRKARKVMKGYDEDIIDQNGTVDEWLAFDSG
jgi:hypothetical protein